MPIGSPLEPLRRVDLFADLTTDELAELAEQFSEATFPSHGRIYRHGDTADFFYVILEGEVAIYREEVGRPLQLQLRLGPGDYFGETGLFGSYRRSSSARAGSVTRTTRIAKQTLLDFLEAHPGVAIKMQIAAARRHTSNVAAALDLGQRSEVRIRIAREVTLELPFGANQEARLENLSLGGMSLRQAPIAWQKGRTVQFSMLHEGESLEVNGRISWRAENTVGIAFVETSEDHDERVQKMIRLLLD